MYPGPHFAGWLGTTQCPGVVATGQWHSGADSDAHSQSDTYTNSETDANSNSYSYAQTDTYADSHSRRRKLLCAVERFPGLHRRHDGQPQWH
jgi:hypothetical protein